VAAITPDKPGIALRRASIARLGLVTRALSALLLTTLPVLSQVLGTPPTYTQKPLSPVPNEGAVTRRIWVPGLDQGFVPQGVSFLDGALYVSGYMSLSTEQGRGPCQLFRIDPVTGRSTGRLDLPPACGHAGGLARGPRQTLFVADTRAVFEIKLEGSSRSSVGAIVRTILLSGNLKGSFAAGSADALWLGTYAEQGPGRLHKFPYASLKAELREADAVLSLPLPERSQGAAFDARGRLWVTQSSSRFGSLSLVNLPDGRVLERVAMPIGVEDASFDNEGGLWTLSEAGSRRWLGWKDFYPLLFRFDMTKLE
jgi:hypothetical protein